MPTVLLLLPAVAAALVTALVWPRVVRGLPEPADGPALGKVPYAALADRAHAVVAAVVVGAACLGLLRVPVAAVPAWIGLATVGTALALVDARTTWLPLRWTHALWALTAAGALALPLTLGWGRTAVAVASAAATGGFLWLFWRLTGGLGFGDVRLGPVIGLAAGAVSPTHAFAAVLLGTLAGAAWGLARAAAGRRGAFAYGPALVAGPWLALLVLPG